MKKITNSTNLKEYLQTVFLEAVTGVKNKTTVVHQKQDGEPVNKKPEDKDLLLDEEEGNNKEKRKEDRVVMRSGKVSTEDIVEKLNLIRAGRSFKDSAIEGLLMQYVDRLTAAEKTALFAYVKGISQIVSGEVPYDNVTKPKDDDPDVSMKKNNLKGGGEINSKGQETVDVKPTVVKKPDEGEEEKEPEEDTTPPVPINPKKGR